MQQLLDLIKQLPEYGQPTGLRDLTGEEVNIGDVGYHLRAFSGSVSPRVVVAAGLTSSKQGLRILVLRDWNIGATRCSPELFVKKTPVSLPEEQYTLICERMELKLEELNA